MTGPILNATNNANSTARTVYEAGLIGIVSYAGNIRQVVFGGQATFNGFRISGTSGSPTALASGDIIVGFGGSGYDGTTYNISAVSTNFIVASENWSSTAHGTRYEFYTTANTTLTRSRTGYWDQDGSLNALFNFNVTGNSILTGTLNSGAFTTTTATFNGLISAAKGIKLTGVATSPAPGNLYLDTNNGMELIAATGLAYDYAIINPALASYILRVPTGTLNVAIGGSLLFISSASVITPGATSLSITNSAATRNNIQILDNGNVTFNFSTTDKAFIGHTAVNGAMPSGLLISNPSNLTGFAAMSFFPSDGTNTYTVGTYYFTGSAVETAWEIANTASGNKGNLRLMPIGGEIRFGDSYATTSSVARLRIYGTTTSNAGGTQVVIVQQGGISTDTILTSADATIGGRLVMSTAVSKIIPGATSISHRNNADSADNLLITDAGNITIRGTLQLGTTYASGATVATGTIPIKDSTGTVYQVLVHT